MQVQLNDDAATRLLGAQLAQSVSIGDVIALTGGLGAGKTTLARGFIQALSNTDEVPSPTYTLVQTYEAEHFEIWHCDLYRLNRPDDILELGLLDAFEEAVCLIEWPDKAGGYLPENSKSIHIEFDGEGRKVTFKRWPDISKVLNSNG